MVTFIIMLINNSNISCFVEGNIGPQILKWVKILLSFLFMRLDAIYVKP